MRIFLILLMIPLMALEQVGSIAGVEGEPVAIGLAKEKRVLHLSSPIFLGDTLTTNELAKAEVKFTDGTSLLLIPNTTYLIGSYAFGGVNDRYFAELKKGGVQISTGLIAKKNPENFALGTPDATIGVRGTVFVTRLVDGNLYVGSSLGDVTVSNRAGSITLESDQYALVTGKKELPQKLESMPQRLDPSHFSPPKSVQTVGAGASNAASSAIAWGPAIGGVAVIGTIVGVVAFFASESPSNYSHTAH